MTKTYLGDGVYVDTSPLGLVLTTENGIEVTNRIMLEPEVYKSLAAYGASRIGCNCVQPIHEDGPCNCGAQEGPPI